MMQHLSQQKIDQVKQLYTTTTQHGATRGLKPFYHILLQEGKIPQQTGWTEFHRVFQTGAPWNKFTESKKNAIKFGSIITASI
jgi:hypothetical protein